MLLSHVKKSGGFSFSLSPPPPSFISPSVTSRTWICSSAARRTSAWGDKMLLRFSIKASLRPLLTSAPAMFPGARARPGHEASATGARSPSDAGLSGAPRIRVSGGRPVLRGGPGCGRRPFHSGGLAAGQGLVLAGKRASLNRPDEYDNVSVVSCRINVLFRLSDRLYIFFLMLINTRMIFLIPAMNATRERVQGPGARQREPPGRRRARLTQFEMPLFVSSFIVYSREQAYAAREEERHC